MEAAALTPGRAVTAEELMALPEDGIDRELIRGRLRERPRRFHTRDHGDVAATLTWLLGDWRESRSEPRGEIHSGGGAFRLCRDPQTLVGVDVAYASAELVARTDEALTFFDGPPTLAVEILSPWDDKGRSSRRSPSISKPAPSSG